jgi:hypothetical protein
MVDLPVGCATLPKEDAHDEQIADHRENGDGQRYPGGRTHGFRLQSSAAPAFLRTLPHLILSSIREKLRARVGERENSRRNNQV